MDFVLFLLVNAALFIRPAELFPEWGEIPLYLILMVCCTLLAAPLIARQLRVSAVRAQPITACVLGMLAAVELSLMWQMKTWEARVLGYEFAKVVLYYLLLVGLLSTAERFRSFLCWLLVAIAVLTALALLQYHGLIDIAALSILQEKATDPTTKEVILVPRLRSTGIFNDPNDLCLILLVGTGIAGCRWEEAGSGVVRYVWLLPAGAFVYALALTQSRGGFLALLAGVMVLIWQKLGIRKAVWAGILLVPVMLVLFAGRQTSITMEEGTGQDRILLWSAGLNLFRQAPIFGIGKDSFAEEIGAVAHNSFVHAFAELGFFGGTLFLGAYFIALLGLHRLGTKPQGPDSLTAARPYLAAIVAGQFVGMLTLSRNYVVPTYMVLGLVAAYFSLSRRQSTVDLPKLNVQLCARLTFASLLFLAVVYACVRSFARFGQVG